MELYERLKRDAEEIPFAVHNFLEVESIEKDRTVVRLTLQPESKNYLGMIHGGLFFTLADTAIGIATHTDGRGYVTQNGNLHFLGNQPEGTIRAIGQVRHRGRSTVLATADIVNEEGKLLATGEFVSFCISEKIIEK